MKVSMERKGQNLIIDIPQDSPDIFADKDKIEQVLQNIISNAIKYTPKAGKISIKLEKEANTQDKD